MSDEWAAVADQYVASISASVRGQVRLHVPHQHLLAHLPAPLATVVDVGRGAGHQSLPLARLGYEVTRVDPAPAMLAKAADLLNRENTATRRRAGRSKQPASKPPKPLPAANSRRSCATAC